MYVCVWGGGTSTTSALVTAGCCHFVSYIGRLVPTGHSLGGRGGSATVQLSYSDCGVQVQFASSAMSVTESRRNVVSYAVRIAAFASGIGFSGYHKLFGHHLGMSVTTDKMFHRVIEEAYPHITEMLDDVCELGKQEMTGSEL